MKRKVLAVLCVLITGCMSLANAGEYDEVKVTAVPITRQIYMIND